MKIGIKEVWYSCIGQLYYSEYKGQTVSQEGVTQFYSSFRVGLVDILAYFWVSFYVAYIAPLVCLFKGHSVQKESHYIWNEQEYTVPSFCSRCGKTKVNNESL